MQVMQGHTCADPSQRRVSRDAPSAAAMMKIT
jgi:hypothetical protein